MTQLPRPLPLLDRFGRRKRRLRVSLTDRCNFRCPYCMPTTPRWASREQLLSCDERSRLLRLTIRELGIEQVRLTGGEPLLSPDLFKVLESLSSLRTQGLHRVSLTTNAWLLARHAEALAAGGLDDLNVSLDAIDPQCFRDLSGGREITPVLDGVTAACAAGLPPKLNAVIIRDRNQHQVLPLVDWAVSRELDLRFIEFMPLDGDRQWSRDRVVSEAEILEQLGAHYSLQAEDQGGGPASYHRISGTRTRVGVIPTVTRPFCGSCDRLRLTATGHLYPCLFADRGPDLRDLLRTGADDGAIKDAIRKAVWEKDEGYVAHPGYTERTISMHGLGG